MKHTLTFISSISLLFSVFLGYAQDVPEISKNLDTIVTKKPKIETVKADKATNSGSSSSNR
ncbi:hypothetical protein [Flavobacterium ginsengisoli]|uniref:hypothetical protein n=1 Tax=Flavobacterium ginsengisoli TaxID=871694 RepID=UPI0030FB45A8